MLAAGAQAARWIGEEFRTLPDPLAKWSIPFSVLQARVSPARTKKVVRSGSPSSSPNRAET